MERIFDFLLQAFKDISDSAKTDAAKDLRAVSDCFRQFGEESTAQFLQTVLRAKEGGHNGKSPRAAGKNPAKLAELIAAIRRFKDHPAEFDYPALRGLGDQAKELKLPELKELGEAVGCPLVGTKAKMVDRLTNWLTNMKMSLDQSSFSLVGAGR